MVQEVRLYTESDFGKKGLKNTKKVEVGKWYVFKSFPSITTYGKVKEIKDGKVFAEKVFDLPSYRPYAATKWFDFLPFAVK